MCLVLGIAGAIVALFLAAVLLRARTLRRMAAAISADVLEPPATVAPILQAPVRHEETWFEQGGSRVALPQYRREALGTLTLTGRDLVVTFEGGGAIHIPLARVIAPSLLPRFGDLTADTVGGIVQVDWSRGEVRISSVFAVDGTRNDAERLRRELHLRAGRAEHVPVAPPPVG